MTEPDVLVAGDVLVDFLPRGLDRRPTK